MDSKEIFPSSACAILEKLPQLDWKAELELKKFKNEGVSHSSAIIAKRVSIGLETVIDPFVVIEDDVIIGKHCLIRPGVFIRSGTIIGDHCVIGHNAEIKHSYIFDHAKIQGNTFVGDSIVGKGARIGTGTVVGNRRFDQDDISWSMKDNSIHSPHDKLGALIGEYVRIGANVTSNPGTVIGAYTWVSGGNVISGYLPPSKFMKIDGSILDNAKAGALSDEDKEGDK